MSNINYTGVDLIWLSGNCYKMVFETNESNQSTNHKGYGQYSEPIKTPSNHVKLTWNTRKSVSKSQLLVLLLIRWKSGDFWLCAEYKSLTYFPTNLGIRIPLSIGRVLAEPYLSPQHCMGWIGQDSGKGIKLQGKIMPKAWGKSLCRLNRTTKCDPYLFIAYCGFQ